MDATPEVCREWIGFIEAGGVNLSPQEWDLVNGCRIALEEGHPLTEKEIASLYRLYQEKSF